VIVAQGIIGSVPFVPACLVLYLHFDSDLKNVG